MDLFLLRLSRGGLCQQISVRIASYTDWPNSVTKFLNTKTRGMKNCYCLAWRSTEESITWYRVTLSLFSGFQVTFISYNVTCVSADAPSLATVTQKEFFLFTQADGVRAGIDYTCHVTMTVTAYNGTTLPNDGGGLGSIETQTSAISEKVSITTLEGRGKSTRKCFVMTFSLRPQCRL